MADTTFISELPAATDITSGVLIPVDVPSGNPVTYDTMKVTAAQVASFVLGQTRKVITAGPNGPIIIDSWMNGKTIVKLIAGGMTYISELDFTQDADSITMTNGLTFYSGQKVLVEL